MLALPSSYEGFGLPVLEAMACGTPVVCSKVSSLPEVAGEAALLIDPDNADQLAEAMISVLTDTALATRLREQGIARAAQYTWQQAAETTLGIYRQLAD
jgi:alpha-1,3-rhamnosyl/mannosyltransferase